MQLPRAESVSGVWKGRANEPDGLSGEQRTSRSSYSNLPLARSSHSQYSRYTLIVQAAHSATTSNVHCRSLPRTTLRICPSYLTIIAEASRRHRCVRSQPHARSHSMLRGLVAWHVFCAVESKRERSRFAHSEVTHTDSDMPRPAVGNTLARKYPRHNPHS